jgi:uncharacterized protein YjiS (DUF1127 family)
MRSFLYASANIIRVIKSRWMRLVGHVAHMGKLRNAYNIWLENMKGRDHLKDLHVDGRIIENGS